MPYTDNIRLLLPDTKYSQLRLIGTNLQERNHLHRS